MLMANKTEKAKTHWLQTPNKNYLGHWDLPNGNDIIVTIKSAQWEEVKNPIINVSEAKRVIRFEEKDIKPFICNETNAQSILKSTGTKYMEDSIGKKIKLYQSQVKVKGEMVDCLRVKEIPQEQLCIAPITKKQLEKVLTLIGAAGKTCKEICEIMKIASVADLPSNKYAKICKRLEDLANE